ncbi:MAG: type IV pilus modification PilV family protein [Myxococcaceae bacterium]
MKRHLRRSERGTSMIEALAAMSIVLVGLLGFLSTQTAVARSNHYSRRLRQASALASDLEENIRRWSYPDARLATNVTVNNFSDSAIVSRWDMGRAQTSTYQAHFSDKGSDANASNSSALGNSYQGVSSDANQDGTADFVRYWNVIAVDLNNTGTANGKLVQIIVRWKEPGFGFRQVTHTAYKANPAAVRL